MGFTDVFSDDDERVSLTDAEQQELAEIEDETPQVAS
ncbi:hypothetical protein FHX81_3314 [Saccharothrix saharensis]|uniref:Uncharacterized protein n=1 Tax=Saccharothrix saharensis TaxID=571190 RepID=A0A543JDM2_9PSEU|nr:hypothetical protein FHX81_3314 [Saccharothrix saharensis]